MTSRGQAARFAYDPALLVDFITTKTTYIQQRKDVSWRGKTRSQVARVRLVNGVRFDQGTDARVLLRWRTNTTGVTRQAAQRLLGRYDLTPQQFERWARARKTKPVLWDITKEN